MDPLMFTSTYERRLVEAKERLDKAKSEVAFFKLQIKQEKKQHLWASSNPEIKALLKQHPTMRCENGAGLTYLSIDVPVLAVRQSRCASLQHLSQDALPCEFVCH